MFEQWIGLVDEVYSFPFANEADKITWKWNMKSGLFTTKSVYNHLSFGEVGLHYRHIWKTKIPYKIKIFVWMLEQNAILTKYNMIRRRWVGDPTCYFCSLPESCGHLFFQCHVAKAVWGGGRYVFWCKQHPTGRGAIQKLDTDLVAWEWNSPHLWLCSNFMGYLEVSKQGMFWQDND